MIWPFANLHSCWLVCKTRKLHLFFVLIIIQSKIFVNYLIVMPFCLFLYFFEFSSKWFVFETKRTLKIIFFGKRIFVLTIWIHIFCFSNLYTWQKRIVWFKTRKNIFVLIIFWKIFCLVKSRGQLFSIFLPKFFVSKSLMIFSIFCVRSAFANSFLSSFHKFVNKKPTFLVFELVYTKLFEVLKKTFNVHFDTW